MSKGNNLENDVLNIIFNATLDSALGVLSTTGNANLYVSLHTADPGEAGAQNTSECAFGSYARVAVARSGSGWTVSGNSAQNAAIINFPECTSGSETVTHVGIGTAPSGTGRLYYKGALTASRYGLS